VGAAAIAAAAAYYLSLHGILAALAGVTVATFALYGLDKRRARRGALRVPEWTLLLFGFVGGSLGALLGQYVFRHKTQKRSFQVMFWMLVVLQIALVAFVLYNLKR
jgi:uncharacterized membrane protein YsdA (DUF1294 family)